jgi:hypothetical protein
MPLLKRSTVILSTLLEMRKSSAEFLSCEPLRSKRVQNAQALSAAARSTIWRILWGEL